MSKTWVDYCKSLTKEEVAEAYANELIGNLNIDEAHKVWLEEKLLELISVYD